MSRTISFEVAESLIPSNDIVHVYSLHAGRLRGHDVPRSFVVRNLSQHTAHYFPELLPLEHPIGYVDAFGPVYVETDVLLLEDGGLPSSFMEQGD